jgi:hypothetical protein
MSRGPQTFRQRDVAAAIRAAKTAGLEVARVEVGKDGKIVIVTTNGVPIEPPAPGNEWDVVFAMQEKDED